MVKKCGTFNVLLNVNVLFIDFLSNACPENVPIKFSRRNRQFEGLLGELFRQLNLVGNVMEKADNHATKVLVLKDTRNPLKIKNIYTNISNNNNKAVIMSIIYKANTIITTITITPKE